MIVWAFFPLTNSFESRKWTLVPSTLFPLMEMRGCRNVSTGTIYLCTSELACVSQPMFVCSHVCFIYCVTSLSSAQTYMLSAEACVCHWLPWRQDVSLSKRSGCKVRQIYGLYNDLRFWQVSLIFIPSVCVQTWRTCWQKLNCNVLSKPCKATQYLSILQEWEHRKL